MAKSILLVENDTAVLGWLKRSLTSGPRRPHVLTAVSPEEAIATVTAHAPDIAAVVCDLHLDDEGTRPAELHRYSARDHDGYVLAQWVKYEYQDIGVFGMTGLMSLANPDQHQWFLAAGDPVTNVGVYHKYVQWPLLRHRALLRAGSPTDIRVFIVHGHDPASQPATHEDLADYARGLGWEPVLLQIGQWQSRTWIESIEREAGRAALAWVVLTPDEEVTPLTPGLVPELRPPARRRSSSAATSLGRSGG